MGVWHGTSAGRLDGSGHSGGSYSPPVLVEWEKRSGNTLVFAATLTQPAGGTHVVLAAPAAGSAVSAEYWGIVNAPNNGQTDESWLTSVAPAFIPGAYGPNGSFELCLATQGGGFRHLYCDRGGPLPYTWPTSGQFYPDRRLTGLALVEDAFTARLFLFATSDNDCLLFVRDASFNWNPPVSVWTPPAGLAVSGVPALWQEQLPALIRPGGEDAARGDLLAGVGLSDGSIQLLRLSYANPRSAAEESRIPPVGELDNQTPQAVALTQPPPAGVRAFLQHRPLEVYGYYGQEMGVAWFSQGSDGWETVVPHTGVSLLATRH
jgi:hypothetical protein